MAKGDFYFPFLFQRFYDSTMGWTEEQEGAYLRLLTYQFKNGFIPDDMKTIRRISPKAAKNWSFFEQKFDQKSDGKFINSVMEKIRKDFNKKREINSLNGKKGGKRSSERYTERLSETPSEKASIPITNNQYHKIDTVLKLEEVGSEKVKEIANEVWKDQSWKEQICIGLSISMDELKKWLAMFNSSVGSDNLPGFNKSQYKKISRGWIVKKIASGMTVENGSIKPSSGSAPLKKLSND